MLYQCTGQMGRVAVIGGSEEYVGFFFPQLRSYHGDVSKGMGSD